MCYCSGGVQVDDVASKRANKGIESNDVDTIIRTREVY